MSAVLDLHSLAMNGGLLDAVERLTREQLDAAQTGFRWLKLEPAADLVATIRHEIAAGALVDEDRAEALEVRADEEYERLVPTDQALYDAFDIRLTEEPASKEANLGPSSQASPEPDLVSEWRAARSEWVEANAEGKLPVHVRNRMMDRTRALETEIAGRPALHGALIALCDPREDPETRLDAAVARRHWDEEGAADTFVSIVVESGASITRPVTMADALRVKTTMTAWTAALCLYDMDRVHD